jgi:peroxin-10
MASLGTAALATRDPFPAAGQPSLIRAQQKVSRHSAFRNPSRSWAALPPSPVTVSLLLVLSSASLPSFPALLQDELYIQYLIDSCHDAVRRLLGPHRALHWASETRALAELLYYALTAGAGLQTPGEEYCDIIQVASSGARKPGAARRGLLVLLQALGPYLAERLVTPEDDAFAAWQRMQAEARAQQAAAARHQRQNQQTDSSAAALLQQVSDAAHRLSSATQHAVQPLTRHLPAAVAVLKSHGPTALRVHLALFYLYGLYYQPTKRLTGGRLCSGVPFTPPV